MRLTSQPIYATLNSEVLMKSDTVECRAAAGTLVEVIGETTMPGQPGTGYFLVRAVQGPCDGAKTTVQYDVLTLVTAPSSP